MLLSKKIKNHFNKIIICLDETTIITMRMAPLLGHHVYTHKKVIIIRAIIKYIPNIITCSRIVLEIFLRTRVRETGVALN